MKTTLLIGIFVSAILSSTAFALTGYGTIDRTKVPDGGFDCAPFDAAARSELMVRSPFTMMIDTKAHVAPVAEGGKGPRAG